MEDDQFPQEDIETIAKNAIVGTLGDCAYNAKKVGDWTNSMTDTILKELQGLNRPFKYVVTTCVEIKILRRVRAESSRRPPRHQRDSCPSDEVVGGFFFDFGAVRTASRDSDAPVLRVHPTILH